MLVASRNTARAMARARPQSSSDVLNKGNQQSKPDKTKGRQRSLQCYRCQGYGHRQSECPTKVSPAKDQRSLRPVS